MVDIKDNAIRILQEYSEIIILGDNQFGGLVFEINGGKYAILQFDKDSFPTVFVIDNNDNYPHLMLSNITVGQESWRSVCLFEAGTLVEYIHTEEEKIRICIDRLYTLVTLSPTEVEEEYHKEFLVYWQKYVVLHEKQSRYRYQLYLDNPDQFQWLQQHQYKNDIIRLTSDGRFFNDCRNRQFINKVPALYLPLIDVRGLLPPLKNKPWSARTINDIVAGVVYQRISDDAFDQIAQTSFSHKEIILAFRLKDYFFACRVEFCNPGTAKLLTKLESQIARVIPINTSRCDFEYLNGLIGNEVHNEHVVVIGAGSLGSYVIDELAHAGYKNITIIDDDTYEYANVFRHRNHFFGSTLSKSYLSEFEVELLHPEINITVKNKRITSDNVSECIPQDTDILIFTVGSSDVQLQMNSVFKKHAYHANIYYAWLEHDGKSSHVAAIKSQQEGCFECLYTDNVGNLCNNTINQTEDSSLVYQRNGCGGTRVHYGNRTLLTAAALVLNALEDNSKHNAIYSFVSGTMSKKPFPKNERCACCGVRE